VGFNRQWQITLRNQHAQARVAQIAKVEDFAELKESDVIRVCRSAAIISGDLAKILEEKLGKRNSAAHPSNVVFAQLQAENYIDELVRNVVLKLA
jgi:ABC-type Zn uptake system ZnuABC Zn-binding protein ZnuA